MTLKTVFGGFLLSNRLETLTDLQTESSTQWEQTLWFSLADIPGETSQESTWTEQPAAMAPFPQGTSLSLPSCLAYTSQTPEEGKARRLALCQSPTKRFHLSPLPTGEWGISRASQCLISWTTMIYSWGRVRRPWPAIYRTKEHINTLLTKLTITQWRGPALN